MSINVNTIPTTVNGLNTFHLVSLATTNATIVKASTGKLCGWAITNTNAALRYICFHDVFVNPTAGSSILWKYGIPSGGASNQYIEFGIQFNNGIGITTVQNAADNDATAVSLNDLIINLFYK